MVQYRNHCIQREVSFEFFFIFEQDFIPKFLYNCLDTSFYRGALGFESWSFQSLKGIKSVHFHLSSIENADNQILITLIKVGGGG